MAGDLITLANLQSMLKDFYLDEDPDQDIEVNVKLIDEVEKVKGKSDADGIRIVGLAKVQQNQGIMTTAFTNSQEPTAGARGYQRYNVQPAYVKAKALFDQQLVQLSKTDAGAFVEELDAMVKDLHNMVRKDAARQINGDGSGNLATLTADVTAAVPATIFLHDTTAIQIGEQLAVFNAAGTFIEAITVITVEPKLNTITANTTINYNSTYFVTKGESSSFNALNSEMLGVRAALADSGTYISIDRTTYAVWRAAVFGTGAISTTARPALFAESDGNIAVANLMKRVAKKGPNGNNMAFEFVMTDFEAYNYAVSAQVNQRRFNDNTKYQTGVTSLLFDDKPVERDAFCSKEFAGLARITAVAGGPVITLSVAPNTILNTSDMLEIYSGNTLIGHLTALNTIGAVTFAATFTAYNGGTVAVGQVIYFDNSDSSTTPVAFTAARVFNNMYFINPETWRMGVWQDIVNLNEAINSIQFEKIAGQTQFAMSLVGLMQPYTVRPNNNGRYKFYIPQSANNGAVSVA